MLVNLTCYIKLIKGLLELSIACSVSTKTIEMMVLF